MESGGVCIETACQDLSDNDGDGYADCADTDCQGSSYCADQIESVCLGYPDQTPKGAQFGNGEGDLGIAWIAPWTGDAPGSANCCGNEANEYYLSQRDVDNVLSENNAIACCNEETDCVTSTGVCLENYALDLTQGLCFENGFLTCKEARKCSFASDPSSLYDCYQFGSGKSATYEWRLKTSQGPCV
jgi:hypothetical protein